MKRDDHLTKIHFIFATVGGKLTACGFNVRAVSCCSYLESAITCPACKSVVKDLEAVYEKAATKNRKARKLSNVKGESL